MNGEQTKFIGKRLIDQGLISEKQLLNALDAQQKSNKPLGQVLIELGYIKEKDLLTLFGKKIESIEKNLASKNISHSVIEKVPPSIVQLYKIIPIDFSKDTLTIAMADPCNVQVLDDLHFRLGVTVKGVLAPEADIEQAIQKYYGDKGSGLNDIIGEITEEAKQALALKKGVSEKDLDEISLKELASQTPVIKLLNLILTQAIKDKASDIHLEPFEDDFKIRYRVDGALYEMNAPPQSLALALTSRVKVMANLDIAERRLPQDGRILMDIGNHQVDLRVSTLPTVFGESVVMRVLDKSVVSLSLEQVGMCDAMLKEFRRLIRKPNGIILVTGPTGSGKTTTLYSALREINKIEYKIITTEDPVEYDIEGIVQVPIIPKINLNFARCLRAILRQDPDIIMVGEIRDEETAEIAIQASLTGHLVFSTLHTNDAPGAVTRLIDMGIEPFLITSSLEAVIAQRLIRTICKKCKEAYKPSDILLQEVGLTRSDVGDRNFHVGRGCSVCNQTGYKGRTAIFEFLILNDVLKELVIEKAPTVVLRQRAQEFGMRTLREDGLIKVLDGITTIEEVVRETQQYT
ncbi:MAG: type II secretion system ATPase GspE [Candidatus Omnitrophica bacterium]|nr:type II secretion system ATPase GspE [Candidatus Omnitrophota bacterium]